MSGKFRDDDLFCDNLNDWGTMRFTLDTIKQGNVAAEATLRCAAAHGSSAGCDAESLCDQLHLHEPSDKQPASKATVVP